MASIDSRYVREKECQLVREGLKEQIQGVKDDVQTVMNNHLPHIAADVKDLQKSQMLNRLLLALTAFLSGASVVLKLLGGIL